MKGRIIKEIAGKFTVQTPEGVITLCGAKGKLKMSGELYVGDIVEFDEKTRTVLRLYERKNMLVRPYVANIDKLVFVMAPVPEPDFLLCDKVIINALALGIDPVVCVNKSDMDGGALKLRVRENYSEIADVIETSAISGDIEEFTKILDGAFVCLAGQSAVGKTSILNALMSFEAGKIGEISEKLKRGKHTTRHSEIFTFGKALIADTSGFSELQLAPMPPYKLAEYYDDFIKFGACRYKGCSHIFESPEDCAVKRAVKNGLLSSERYERYVILYAKTDEAWKNRYD